MLDRYPARYARRALLLTPPCVISIYLAWTHSSSFVVILMSAAAALLCIQLGLIAHDAGHRAVARANWANAFAGHVMFTVLNGLGFQSWRVTHNAHHAGCQDESADPDMWVDILVSLTPRSARARTSPRMDSLGRLTSRPRVRGTTQKLQKRSQPSITVTKARPGVGEVYSG